MSYTKQTHVAGQKLTAAQLNYMENGIMKAQNVYNLLDNSDFSNPVNQRAVTSTKWGGYNIDRWSMFPSGTRGDEHFGVVKNSYINLTSTVDGYVDFYQKMERYDNIKGGTYTFTAKLLYNGNLVTSVCTFVMGGEGHGKNLTADGLVQFFSTSEGNVLIRVNNNAGAANTVSLVWAALYEGEYTADNLPPYVPKGYSAELAECQRYFFQIGTYSPIGNGYSVGSENARIAIVTPVEMRIKPSLNDSFDLIIVGSGVSKTVTSITVGSKSGNIVRLNIVSSGLTAGSTYSAYMGGTGALQLSADL